MPLRTFRASKAAYARGSGHVGANISANLGIWMAVAAAVAAVGILLNWLAAGRGSHWGHLAAFAGMLLGILIMMKAQEGHVAPAGPDDDDDEAA